MKYFLSFLLILWLIIPGLVLAEEDEWGYHSKDDYHFKGFEEHQEDYQMNQRHRSTPNYRQPQGAIEPETERYYSQTGNEYGDYQQSQGLDRNQEDYPYESHSGTRYEYDLSKPGDRMRYEVDPGAQLRDSVNPRVEIDRNLGQYGGGAE